jgi:uncharacterized RDD family membrane protein YckC
VPPSVGGSWTGPPLVEWPQRALALLIDWGIGVVAFFALYIVALIFYAVSDVLGLLVLVLTWALGLAYTVFLGLWTGQTGQTIGKRTIGIKIVRADDQQLLGAGPGVARQFAHILDSLPCYIGYLWPLWDPMKQTFADKVMRSVAITVPKQPFSITPPS